MQLTYQLTYWERRYRWRIALLKLWSKALKWRGQSDEDS